MNPRGAQYSAWCKQVPKLCVQRMGYRPSDSISCCQKTCRASKERADREAACAVRSRQIVSSILSLLGGERRTCEEFRLTLDVFQEEAGPCGRPAARYTLMRSRAARKARHPRFSGK
ncbi:hypothetical protein CesoFtcFv8_027254 [Champsocephalus esox]|uniref:Uncharacterized protein n=2 Tax=Champsocephalus esox TaxID=159716 RepID=A0AAN8B0Q6_9TELE|nr:hypothetical protein CesoFtcFv8_027254 [Champsocephalus esox]